MKKMLIILFYCLFVITILISYEKYVDFDLIKKPGAPRFVNNGILFTLPGGEGKIIFLRTDLDLWKTDYYFQVNLYGVNYLFLPYSRGVEKIKYKLNVNGYWELDPYNTLTEMDELATDVSIIYLPEEEPYQRELPVITDIDNHLKNVTFKYFNEDANEVNLVCSVDNWSCYSHPMKKNKYGNWEYSMKFNYGTFYYYFLVDGKKEIDLENSRKVNKEHKGQLSYFVID